MEAWTRVEITTGPDPYHLTGWAGGGYLMSGPPRPLPTLQFLL